MRKTNPPPIWQQIVHDINERDPTAFARWGAKSNAVDGSFRVSENSIAFSVRNRHTDLARITIIDLSYEYWVIYTDGTFNPGYTGRGLNEDIEKQVEPEELVRVVDNLVDKHDAPEVT